MAGEDPEMVEIKPGYRIGLILDKNEEVSKIILNNKDKYPDARIVEVEDADIEHTLVIKGYVEGEEDESIQIFKVSRSAVLVEDGTETLIAPYDRQFASKTLGQRTMAIFAGPMMNFVLAFIVFVLIALLQGIPTNEPALGKLTPDGAAYEAGLKEGDMVQSVDGAEISSWSDVVEIIRKNPSEELEFLVERNGQEHTILVTPKVQNVEGEKIGIIGVYSPMEKSPLKAITYGAKETYFWTKKFLLCWASLSLVSFQLMHYQAR